VTGRPSGWAALAIITVAVAGAFVLLWSIWPSSPTAAPARSLDESNADGGEARRAPSLPTATASPPPERVARPSTRVVPPPPVPTEPALIATLRLMVETAPQQSLDLAREARRRFGRSPDAAERDWIIVKSLVNLRRFH
jgi:hypothetical protein